MQLKMAMEVQRFPRGVRNELGFIGDTTNENQTEANSPPNESNDIPWLQIVAEFVPYRHIDRACLVRHSTRSHIMTVLRFGRFT